jgi:hypothetical protein
MVQVFGEIASVNKLVSMVIGVELVAVTANITANQTMV